MKMAQIALSAQPVDGSGEIEDLRRESNMVRFPPSKSD
jgi:hypothetical protein